MRMDDFLMQRQEYLIFFLILFSPTILYYAKKLLCVFHRIQTGAEFPETGIELATGHPIIHRLDRYIRVEGEIRKVKLIHFSLKR